MDDEATRLLREIRELLVRFQAIEESWIEEQRRLQDESAQRWIKATAENQRASRINNLVICSLFAILIFVFAVDVFAMLRARGVL